MTLHDIVVAHYLTPLLQWDFTYSACNRILLWDYRFNLIYFRVKTGQVVLLVVVSFGSLSHFNVFSGYLKLLYFGSGLDNINPDVMQFLETVKNSKITTYVPAIFSRSYP